MSLAIFLVLQLVRFYRTVTTGKLLTVPYQRGFLSDCTQKYPPPSTPSFLSAPFGTKTESSAYGGGNNRTRKREDSQHAVKEQGHEQAETLPTPSGHLQKMTQSE